MSHNFRSRLMAGELLIGTIITLNSPEVAEVLAEIGFDWLFVDAEHAPLSMQDIQHLMQAAGKECPCVVRLSSISEATIKQALDIGAAGIIAPLVNTAQQAERIVGLSKYAPEGTRGVGVARAHRYGIKFQEYVETANDNVAVIVQAEHVEAVENIESIVKVPGVDAVFVGPYDLSASLGKLGQVNDPEVIEAIEFVTSTCRRAGMPLGIFGLSAEAVQPYIDRGYTLIVAGIDAVLLGQAGGQLLTKLKEGLQ